VHLAAYVVMVIFSYIGTLLVFVGILWREV